MTTIAPLALDGVLLITPKRHGDARGWFSETWSQEALSAAGLVTDFVQDNQAFNARKGTLRGLHFQKSPHPQGKLVRVLKGAIFDVAVDVRSGSPTYGRWTGATLTAEAGEQIWVPRGFAHGYVTLTDDTELFYKVDGDYAPQLEGGVIWNDPDIGIDWPLDGEPVLSDKDRELPRLRDMPKAAFEPSARTAPGADRIVSLDHNQPDYLEAMAALDELIDTVRESNSYREQEPADQERRLSELEAGRRLLRSRWVSVATVRAALGGTLAYLALKFVDAPIGEAASYLWSAIKRLIGL